MAFSGNISQRTFDARKVIDHAFLRCRMPLQGITSEMIETALDALYLMLSDLGNGKSLSWAVDKQVLPFYQNSTQVVLPKGTLDVFSVQYRKIAEQTGTVTTASTTHKTLFATATKISTVGIKWTGASVGLTFAVSDDDVSYTTVGTWAGTAAAGEIIWVDIDVPVSALYFRITGAAALSYEWVVLGNNPTEIIMGMINRDQYFYLPNKTQIGQPVQYWYQRDIPQPVLNIWPVPNSAFERIQQCTVWRQRHIMDTDNTRQDVEVPQRWLNAIVDGLAYKLAQITPSVDINLIPVLQANASNSLALAQSGDNSGSRITFNFGLAGYT